MSPKARTAASVAAVLIVCVLIFSVAFNYSRKQEREKEKKSMDDMLRVIKEENENPSWKKRTPVNGFYDSFMNNKHPWDQNDDKYKLK